jgi:hypothetical protein
MTKIFLSVWTEPWWVFLTRWQRTLLLGFGRVRDGKPALLGVQLSPVDTPWPRLCRSVYPICRRGT